MLDVYELCTPELQEKMVSFRSKFKDLEDKKVNQQPNAVGSFFCIFNYCHLNLHLVPSSSHYYYENDQPTFQVGGAYIVHILMLAVVAVM